ncbi:Phosphatidylinositol-4-phosphate 5-kinase [Ascosphaera aggregata]|nr:Phosphatidylinositol-4-phosphate 5-kinase [Ascosphaera aggregata]
MPSKNDNADADDAAPAAATATTGQICRTSSITADFALEVNGLYSPLLSSHHSSLSCTRDGLDGLDGQEVRDGRNGRNGRDKHQIGQQQKQQQPQQQEEEEEEEEKEGKGVEEQQSQHDNNQQYYQVQPQHPHHCSNNTQGQGREQGHLVNSHRPKHWQIDTFDTTHSSPSPLSESQQEHHLLSVDTDLLDVPKESIQEQQLYSIDTQAGQRQDPSPPNSCWYSSAAATTPTPPKVTYEDYDYNHASQLPEDAENNDERISEIQPSTQLNGQSTLHPQSDKRRRNPNREFSFTPGMFQGMLSSLPPEAQRELSPRARTDTNDSESDGKQARHLHQQHHQHHQQQQQQPSQQNSNNTFDLPLPRSLADQPCGRGDSYLSAAGTPTSGYLSVNGFLDDYALSSLSGSSVELGAGMNHDHSDYNRSGENDHHYPFTRMNDHHHHHHNSNNTTSNGYDNYDSPRSSYSSPSIQDMTRLRPEDGTDRDDTHTKPTYLQFHYAQSDTQTQAQAQAQSRPRSQSHFSSRLRHSSQQDQQQLQKSITSPSNTEHIERYPTSSFYTTPKHSLDRENSSSPFPLYEQQLQTSSDHADTTQTKTTAEPPTTIVTAAYMSQPPHPPQLHIGSTTGSSPLEAPKPERPLQAQPHFSLSTPASPGVRPAFSKDQMPNRQTNSPTPGQSTQRSSDNGLQVVTDQQQQQLRHPYPVRSSSFSSQQQLEGHTQPLPSPPSNVPSSFSPPTLSTRLSFNHSIPRRASVSLGSPRNSRGQSNGNPPLLTADGGGEGGAGSTNGDGGGVSDPAYEETTPNRVSRTLTHSQSQPRLRTVSRTETFRSQQRRLSRIRRRRREEEDDDKVVVGTKVDQNHQNFVTAYNMLTGIRFTVSRTNAKLDRPLKDEDFDACFKFSFDVAGRELTPSAKYDFKFKDYAPWVFRHLRARFKLDPADYLMSLTSKYILSELGSPGKSGSFFYFSRDYKYIIKTIHHSEHKLLRRILRDYYEHVDKNPNTLISQFYGLHRVKMAYGRKIHFVVMNNLFPPHRDIHQMFDLKGSTVGRDYREEDLARNPRATMKDLNWLRREKRLHCGPLRKDVFMAQVKRDVALLQRLNIMDYSLLVGMHDTRKGNDEQLRDRALQVYQSGSTDAGQLQGNGNGTDELVKQDVAVQAQRDSSLLGSAAAQGSTLPNLEPTTSSSSSRFSLLAGRQSRRGMGVLPLEKMKDKSIDEILDQTKQLVFYSEEGGFKATNQAGDAIGEIYYLGIIDCLTTYGVVKKAENFWKGLSHNRNEISPIPPVSYANRFVEFIEHITKSPEQHAREREERESERERQRALGLRPSVSSDGPTDSTQNFFGSPNGKGKGPADGTGPHNQHILSAVNDHAGSSADVLPVVEEVPGESSNASIRSQHASSMQIYENLMKGTSSRYEVRLSTAGPGLPGSNSSTNVRRPYTLPDSLTMDGSPYDFPPDAAGTGDDGRIGSADSAGSDSSYGGGGPGGPGLGHGHDYHGYGYDYAADAGAGGCGGSAAAAAAAGSSAANNEPHTNVGGQQHFPHPELPNFLRPGDQHNGDNDDKNCNNLNNDNLGKHQVDQPRIQQQQQQNQPHHPAGIRPYIPEDTYPYDTDGTPPSSATMHVPHLPPPPDSMPRLPPGPLTSESAPPQPPSPPPSWEPDHSFVYHQRSSSDASSDGGANVKAPTRSSVIAKNDMFLDAFPKPPLSPTMSRS